MANNPTVGIFLPGGYLNNFNSASPTGQIDAYGLVYPSGSNIGKMIELGDNEAANLTAPQSVQASAGGNPLFGGAYQIVQVDSSATAANVIPGNVAYIKLNQNGVAAGTLPETGFSTIVVTDFSHADTPGLFAGVFLNPITPGQFGLIFVGAGRTTVNVGTAGSPAIGSQVNVAGTTGGGGTGGVNTLGAGLAPTAGTLGTAVTLPVASGTTVVYVPNILYRLPN